LSDLHSIQAGLFEVGHVKKSNILRASDAELVQTWRKGLELEANEEAV